MLVIGTEGLGLKNRNFNKKTLCFPSSKWVADFLQSWEKVKAVRKRSGALTSVTQWPGTS